MITNPKFFIGKVLNVDDINRLSRVRVSIFGEHDELTGDQLGQLPWSLVMMPNTTAGKPGIGASVGLKEGSTVFGLYINESDTLILGCIQSSVAVDK